MLVHFVRQDKIRNCSRECRYRTTITAKSSWNAAENSCECTVFPSKAFLIGHPVEENDSPPGTMLSFEDKTLSKMNCTPAGPLLTYKLEGGNCPPSFFACPPVAAKSTVCPPPQYMVSFFFDVLAAFRFSSSEGKIYSQRR